MLLQGKCDFSLTTQLKYYPHYLYLSGKGNIPSTSG